MAITKTIVAVNNISTLSDTPNATEGLTAAQLKARHDKTGADLKTYINDILTEELDTAIETLDTEVGVLNTKTTTIQTGWNSAGETWTYASVDDPTGVITISGDKTTKYSVGMRIKFTNATNVIYGIITAISYSSPNTTLTFLHQIDPTDSLALYLMANSAITANYYSNMKAPYGFPMNPDKWSVVVANGTTYTQSNPANGTWYNFVSGSIPIGVWITNIAGTITGVRGDTAGNSIWATLSSANNSSTYPQFNFQTYVGAMAVLLTSFFKLNTLTFTVKTIVYLNIRTDATGLTAIKLEGQNSTSIIKATSAYL